MPNEGRGQEGKRGGRRISRSSGGPRRLQACRRSLDRDIGFGREIIHLHVLQRYESVSRLPEVRASRPVLCRDVMMMTHASCLFPKSLLDRSLSCRSRHGCSPRRDRAGGQCCSCSSHERAQPQEIESCTGDATLPRPFSLHPGACEFLSPHTKPKL